MSSPNHYKPNLRDISFNLFEFLDIGRTSLGKGPFGDIDETAARQTLETLEQVCLNEVAPSFAESDHTPPVLENGQVTLPPLLKRAIAAYYDSGMNQLELPPHLGGLGAPPSLCWGAFELLVGASAPVAFYTLGTLVSRVIDRLGTEAQKRRFLPHINEKRWIGTMVLTEPDAGSDVGAARTKARHVGDGIWEIEGVKRFITSAEHDASENIIHMVLARPEGAGPGTKGLSLFIVPKFWVEEERHAGRAQRRGVHQAREEDGHQGLRHLRADVRRRQAGARPAAGRGARRHPADVPHHRAGAHGGGHEVHGHAVHRVPERAGLRQGAQAGRGPARRARQDGAASDHHPPPGRAPDADGAEGPRRGHARPEPLHRLPPGPGGDQGRPPRAGGRGAGRAQ